MNRLNRLFGLLAAIVVGALVAVGVQAFSAATPGAAPSAAQQQQADPADAVTLVPVDEEAMTPVPMQSSRGEGLVDVEGLDDPNRVTVVDSNEPPIPTAEPLANAPAPAALASETVRYANDFSSTGLDGWRYAQVYDEPTEAPEWSVYTTEILDHVLVAPENRYAINVYNDTMALPPVSLDSNGAIEVSAMATTAQQLGLVLGFADDNNYVAMTLGTAEANGLPSPGLALVQVQDGTATTLTVANDTLLEQDRWYRLRFAVQGTTVIASIDGKEVARVTLDSALAGSGVGIYAGSGGYGIYDNLRVVGNE